jgi:hypothetical protein
MKILVLLSASLFGFGLACNESVQVDKAAQLPVVQVVAPATEIEVPVMHVLLDTVEITATAPAAIAGNLE